MRSSVSFGAGGMATVRRDLKHDRLVAIRVLRPELAVSLGSDRFLREIEPAARLNASTNDDHLAGIAGCEGGSEAGSSWSESFRGQERGTATALTVLARF